MKTGTLILVIILVAVTGAGAYFFAQSQKKKDGLFNGGLFENIIQPLIGNQLKKSSLK